MMGGETNGKRREYMSRAELITEIERLESAVSELVGGIYEHHSSDHALYEIAEEHDDE